VCVCVQCGRYKSLEIIFYLLTGVAPSVIVFAMVSVIFTVSTTGTCTVPVQA